MVCPTKPFFSHNRSYLYLYEFGKITVTNRTSQIAALASVRLRPTFTFKFRPTFLHLDIIKHALFRRAHGSDIFFVLMVPTEMFAHSETEVGLFCFVQPTVVGW